MGSCTSPAMVEKPGRKFPTICPKPVGFTRPSFRTGAWTGICEPQWLSLRPNLSAYLYMSDDYGQNWQRIGTDLPAEPINVVKEVPFES